MNKNNSHTLGELLDQRLVVAGPFFRNKMLQASQVIVFGSMSAGCDRSNSDLDVLCISGNEYLKFKNTSLDLIVVPSGVISDSQWLQGELATHVAAYGSWTTGAPTWTARSQVGKKAIYKKRRRIAAFIKGLASSWTRLEPCFQMKYITKLRRETQRLILLEGNVAVPPTAVLDHSWTRFGGSSCDVLDRLRMFDQINHGSFAETLIACVMSQIDENPVRNSCTHPAREVFESFRDSCGTAR